jgi:hypothetical protein
LKAFLSLLQAFLTAFAGLLKALHHRKPSNKDLLKAIWRPLNGLFQVFYRFLLRPFERPFNKPSKSLLKAFEKPCEGHLEAFKRPFEKPSKYL